MTKQQEEFCRQYIINKENATEAYRKAYNSCKKDSTAYTNSSNLLRNTKVKEYIAKLREEASKKFEITRDTQIKHLETIRKSMMGEDGDKRVAIKAIEEQSKLLGLYESAKVDVTTKGEKMGGGTVNIIQIPDNGRDLTS